jgi:hypothetical protein
MPQKSPKLKEEKMSFVGLHLLAVAVLSIPNTKERL